MLHALFILGCMTLGAVALWGWGIAFLKLSKGPPLAGAIEIVLGLASVIFLGGILNLAGWAYGPALDAIGVAGCLFALTAWRRVVARWRTITRADCIALVPVAGVALFVSSYLTPPAGFNWHDDLERYFAYPVRMLATGTLAGNSLGYIGADTLGAQAFLQGFVNAHRPIQDVAAVDCGFCLVLCVVIAGFSLRPRGWGLVAVVAELLVVAINPLVVNISSVFSSALFVAGLGFLTASPRVPERRNLVPIGLIYAALLALKTTNAVFVAVHFTVWLVLQGHAHDATRSWRRAGAIVVASVVVFLSPWVLTHAAVFSAMEPHATAETATTHLTEPLRLFGSELGSYGASQTSYTTTALVVLAISILAWLPTRRGTPEQKTAGRSLLAAGIAGILTFLSLAVFLAPLVFGEIASFRYVCPVLVGLAASVAAIAGTAAAPLKSPLFRWLPLALAVVPLVVFLPSTLHRARTIARLGTPLAFLSRNEIATAYTQAYAPYVHARLQDTQRTRIAGIQALVPPNEPIVAWVMTPFWFDFRRNPIYHTDPYGLAMPWTKIPTARYFVWEYAGGVVRPEQRYVEMMNDSGASERVAGARALAFIRDLETRVKNGTLL